MNYTQKNINQQKFLLDMQRSFLFIYLGMLLNLVNHDIVDVG